MADVESQFIADLQREDDVGLVKRGLLHVEHQLIELATTRLPFASRVDWNEISFRAKLEIAYACGLPEDRKKLISSLNSLRNKFAHRLDATISKAEFVKIYNNLPSNIRETIKGTHQLMGLGVFPGPASLDPRDLLIHLFMSARQATKAAADRLRNQ